MGLEETLALTPALLRIR